MDKIEKLELPYDDGKGNFSSGAGEIQIIRKVNEIIDVLNSQLFEPKILNCPTDQSQKQPEGELTAGDVFQLRRLEAFAEDYKELKESMKQPEGEKEMTKEDIEYLEKQREKEIQEGIAWIKQREGESEKQEQFDKLVDFISQLLSERTFNKDELRVIKSDLSLVVSDFGVNDESFYENLIAKIGKLLKEEE
jgi:hypothetical protein